MGFRALSWPLPANSLRTAPEPLTGTPQEMQPGSGRLRGSLSTSGKGARFSAGRLSPHLTAAVLMFPVMTQLTERLVLKSPSGVLWVWDAARVMDAAGALGLCQEE